MKQKRQNQQKISPCSGQSITEFLILVAIIVPLGLMLPLLGGVLDIQFKTHEAARYVSWERTVWSENSKISANADDAIKSGAVLANEAELLFFKSPLLGLHQIRIKESASLPENFLWKNQLHQSLLSNEQNKTTGKNGVALLTAQKMGVYEQASDTPGFNPMDAMTQHSVGGWFKLGLPFSGKQTFGRFEVTRPLSPIWVSDMGLNAKRSAKQKDEASFEPTLKSNSAILSQVWIASSEEQFAKSVRQLVADGNTLEWGFEQIGYLFDMISKPLPSAVFPFKEIRYAYVNNTELLPLNMSKVLPDYASHDVTRPRYTPRPGDSDWVVP